MKLILFVIIISLLLISSCQYEPTGSEFTDLNLPDPTGMSVWLTPDVNFLTIAFKTEFNYEISEGKGKLINTTVKFNGKVIHNSEKIIDKFSIETEYFNNGLYKLELQTTIKTQSGSLADKFESEAFILKQEWTIEIKKFDYQTRPVLISVIKDNNKVKLTWNKFLYQGYIGYVVNKYDPKDPNNNSKTFWSDTIFNPDDTIFYDKFYLAGQVAYKVIAFFERTGYPYPNFTSNSINFGDSIGLKYDISGNLDSKIYWNKCKFPDNFLAYRISEYNGNDYNPLFESNNINDTSITLNFGLFRSKSLYIDYVSKDSMDFAPYPYREKYQILFPYIWETFNYGELTHCYNNDNTIYYRHYQTNLNKFDLNKMQITGKFSAPDNWFEGLNVSDNNKYFTGFNGHYGETIYIVNPISFSISSSVNLNAFLPPFMAVENTSVSNNGLLIACITRYYELPNAMLLYDIENRTVTDIDTSLYVDNVKISASGKFAFAMNIEQKKFYLFKIVDKKLSLFKSKDMEVSTYRTRFIPNEDKLALIENGNISIYDCSTFNVTLQFPVAAKYIIDIDYKTNRVLTANENLKLFVYDLSDGKLVTTINNGYLDMIYLNNTLVTNGIYYKLEN